MKSLFHRFFDSSRSYKTDSMYSPLTPLKSQEHTVYSKPGVVDRLFKGDSNSKRLSITKQPLLSVINAHLIEYPYPIQSQLLLGVW